MSPGQHVTLSSNTWFGICNDTGQRIDVTDRAVVTFVQGNLHRELGRTASNASGVFRITVRVPAAARSGPAVLQVRGRAAADDVPLTITTRSLPHTGSTPLVGLLGVAALCAAFGLRRVESLGLHAVAQP